MANDPPRDSRTQNDRQRQPNQQGSQNEGPQQPAQGQSGGQQPQRTQRGQPQQAPPRGRQPDGDDGLSRRQLLLGGGGVLAAAGGGWYFFLRGRGPTGTVEAFFGALDDGNVSRANELIHQDSPGGNLNQSDIVYESYTVESTEVVDGDIGYSASEFNSVQEFEGVEARVTVGSQGEQQTDTTGYVVAKNGSGEWKMWE